MNLKQRAWFPIVYMFIVTLCLSAVLIIFGSATRQRVKNNERIAYERAVIQALSIELPARVSPSRIHEIYVANLYDATESSAGALRYITDDTLAGYALPIQGPGFWALIRGVIGIAVDMRTITGISFYEQNETPGLGGEIVKNEFREQFVGKQLSPNGVPIQFRAATEPLDESSVHAITGATQTSTRLSKFLNEQLTIWRDRMKVKQ